MKGEGEAGRGDRRHEVEGELGSLCEGVGKGKKGKGVKGKAMEGMDGGSREGLKS